MTNNKYSVERHHDSRTNKYATNNHFPAVLFTLCGRPLKYTKEDYNN